MGSRPKRNSTRARRGRSVRSSRHQPGRSPDDHPRQRSKQRVVKSREGERETVVRERQPPKANLDAILGRFADALSFVSTATHTLISAEDRIHVATRYDASETLHTLTHGLNELNRVYNDLDRAIMELS